MFMQDKSNDSVHVDATFHMPVAELVKSGVHMPAMQQCSFLTTGCTVVIDGSLKEVLYFPPGSTTELELFILVKKKVCVTIYSLMQTHKERHFPLNM